MQRWDKCIGKYIKPIFLEIGAHGYGLKKEFNDDIETHEKVLPLTRTFQSTLL